MNTDDHRDTIQMVVAIVAAAGYVFVIVKLTMAIAGTSAPLLTALVAAAIGALIVAPFLVDPIAEVLR